MALPDNKRDQVERDIPASTEITREPRQNTFYSHPPDRPKGRLTFERVLQAGDRRLGVDGKKYSAKMALSASTLARLRTQVRQTAKKEHFLGDSMLNQDREVAVLTPPAGKDRIVSAVKSRHGPGLAIEASAG